MNGLRDFSNALALPIFVVGGILFIVRTWLNYNRLQQNAIQWREAMAITPVLKEKPSVSVLVAAWNEARNIEAHVGAFKTLRYPNKQLILCAGGNDNTYLLARQAAGDDPAIRILEQIPGEGKQRSLKRCLAHSDGQIIYLTDGDCLLNDNAFERVIAPLVNAGAAAATGASIPLERQRLFWLPAYLWAQDHRWNLIIPDPSLGLLGRNCAVTRAALEATGGFNQDAFSGTDYTLARQLMNGGYIIRRVSTSILESENPVTIRHYFDQRIRWSRNMIVIGRDTGDRFAVFQSLIGVGISIVFLILPLFSLVFGGSVLALWGLLLLHGLLTRAVDVFLLTDLRGSTKIRAFCAGFVLFWVDIVIRIRAALEGFFPSLQTTWKQQTISTSNPHSLL